MVDMNATTSVSGLKHPVDPVDNNTDGAKIENKEIVNCENIVYVEAEEGQIIEDVEFEDISSDEDPIVFTEADEASMRKRIEELELRNAELEKIAVISVINNYDLGSNKIVAQSENQPVDVIEVSDYDEYSEYASNDITSAFIPYDKYSVLKTYYKKYSKASSGFPTIPTKTYHKSRKRRKRAHSTENKNFDENKSSKMSRIKKRRKRSPSSSLDCSNTRLKSSNTRHHQSRSKRSKRKRRIKTQHYGSTSHDSDSEKSESYELNREELRKAVKRSSETISKGNLQNIVSNNKIQMLASQDDDVIEIENDDEVEKITSNEVVINNSIPSEDSDSLEEQTLRLIALKSAIVKKHLDRKKRKEIDEKKPYSPSDFDYWCSGINIENSPKEFVDLENIDSNNISPSDSPINLSDEDVEKQDEINLIQIDTDSDEPKFIDTRNNLSSIDALKKLAPPAPQITIISPTPIRFDKKGFKEDVKKMKEDESKLIISQKNSSPDDLSDEEELALRALLLSTMNSPKGNNSSIRKTVLTDNSQNTVLCKNSELLVKNARLEKIENSLIPICNEIKEDESSIDSHGTIVLKVKNTNKAESLLKEAVKRLKTTTLNDLSENDQIIEANTFLSQNKTDKSLKHIVPNSKDSFKEIQIPAEQEIPIEVIELCNADELLTESRKKLNKFIQCFNKDKLSSSDVEQVQNSGEVSDWEEPDQIAETDVFDYDIKELEENIPSESCIEALQKIIELNYEKLVKVRPKENDIIENVENKECCYDSNDSLQKSPKDENDSNDSLQKSPKDENDSDIEQIASAHNLKEDILEHEEIVDNNSIEKIDIDVSLENQNKIDTSLEITKKIESLQKLSESIEQTTKITAKAKASLDVNKPQSINTNSLIANNSVQNRKIVKINKIINQTSSNMLNHNNASNNVSSSKSIKISSMPMISRKSPQTVSDITINSNRVSKISRTTGKIIITVGVTSSSDDDDNMWDDPYDKYNKNIDLQYDDNASPMSFQMDSPCYSPYINTVSTENPYVEEIENIHIVKNTKSDITGENKILTDSITVNSDSPLSKKLIHDVFQAKLDKFLKNARTQVELEKKAEKNNQNVNTEPKTPVSKLVHTTNLTTVTPIAVRHLPESSQLEYRMLINRMKILERQKQMKTQQPTEQILSTNLDPNTTELITENSSSKKIDQKDPKVINETEKNMEINNIEKNDSSNGDQRVETSELNQITVPNITNEMIEDKSLHIVDKSDLKSNEDNEKSDKQNLPDSDTNAKKEDKTAKNLELLKKYEIAHDKNSILILENLNRAVKFATMGKEAKTKKVLLEAKLERLKSEIKNFETDLKLQNQKIAKIYPAISKSYETIVHLKARRMKLSKISKQLGKTINGDSYVFKEGLSVEIQNKFKHLSSEINYLKNLKIDDIEKNTNESQINSKTESQVSPSKNTESKEIKPNFEQEMDKHNVNNNQVTVDSKINNSMNDNNGLTNIELHQKKDSEEGVINEMVKGKQFESTNDGGATLQKENIELNQEEPIFDESCKVVLTGSNSDNGNCKYISPLDFLNERQSSTVTCNINPNEVICPFQLMGQCDDKDCKYNHLNLDCTS